MQNPPAEGEDVFFDSLDHLSTSFCSTLSEDILTENSELEFENFGCEIWTSELRSIRERRNSFLHRMGFHEFVPSESCCSQGVEQKYCRESLQQPALDRIMENGDAVLDSSTSGSESKEGNQHCTRDLDQEKLLDAHELGQDRWLSTTQREVDSGEAITGDEFEMSHGLSDSVKRENVSSKERRDGGFFRRKNKLKSWWKGLYARRQSGECCSVSNHNTQMHKAERTRVQRHGKRCMEFTAVHMNQEFHAHKGSIWTMKFSPDGRYLATGGEDCIVRVWHVVEVEISCKYSSGDCMPKFGDKVKECKSILKNCCFDSSLIVIPKKAFKIEETPIHEFHGHASDVLDLSWSKSNCLLTSSKDKTIHMWQVGHDYCLGVFRHSNYVTCVQFNPIDDGYFISGSIDGKVRIWRITESRVVDWVDVREIISAVCYRPDGQGFVVGSITGNCRFYYLSGNYLQLDAELNIQGKKKASSKRITGFQFIPEDPERVMITSADSKVRIVDGIDVIHKYGGPRKLKSQLSASFTSDGRYIVSIGEDSCVYIWNYSVSSSPSSKGTKSVRSCEYFFSKDASIAIPWPGTDNIEPASSNSTSHLQRGKILEPLACVRDSEHFCLGAWFFADCPSRASATWPEEKLGLWADATGAIGVHPCDGHAYDPHYLKPLSPAMWSQVIVTAGNDGAIRSFHNYGLPVRLRAWENFPLYKGCKLHVEPSGCALLHQGASFCGLW